MSTPTDKEVIDWLELNLQAMVCWTEPTARGNWYRLDYRRRTLQRSRDARADGKTIREAVRRAMRGTLRP